MKTVRPEIHATISVKAALAWQSGLGFKIRRKFRSEKSESVLNLLMLKLFMRGEVNLAGQQ